MKHKIQQLQIMSLIQIPLQMNVESKANYLVEQYEIVNALYGRSARRINFPQKASRIYRSLIFFIVLLHALMLLILNLHEFDPFARSVSMHSS
jgi:hypothetical protein